MRDYDVSFKYPPLLKFKPCWRNKEKEGRKKKPFSYNENDYHFDATKPSVNKNHSTCPWELGSLYGQVTQFMISQVK